MLLLLACCVIILLILGSLVLVRTCLIVVTVTNHSMFPTLEAGDRVLVLRKRLVPRLRRGQIVVFIPPHLSEALPTISEATLYIKRIVALGGEILEDEDTSRRKLNAMGMRAGRHTWHIPQGALFVRGDNPHGSVDSRSWGPIPAQSIRGVVLFKLTRKAPVSSVVAKDKPMS
jgi:signal peptidase I